MFFVLLECFKKIFVSCSFLRRDCRHPGYSRRKNSPGYARAAVVFLSDGVGLGGFAEPSEHRLFDGSENILIARAPAQMAGQELSQLVVCILFAGSQPS